MTAETTDAWPGCHGVCVRANADLGLGRFSSPPLADAAVVEEVPAGDRRAEQWAVRLGDAKEAEAAGHRLIAHGDGEYTAEVGVDRRVGISVPSRRLVVSDLGDPIQLQLVASLGLPMMVAGSPVLILHAAAAVRSGPAVLVAGPSGTGKSSSLVGLIEAGGQALSE